MAKNTVLIVEDDAALNEMLRFMLERNGYNTLQVSGPNIDIGLKEFELLYLFFRKPSH